MYTYNAKVLNVVDGDTFDLMVDLGFSIFHKVRVRLLEIDTPETRGEETELGLKCKDFARNLLLGEDVIITSKRVSEDVKTDSFGRWLCYLWVRNINIIDIYNRRQINKKHEFYSEDAVRNLDIDNVNVL